MIWNRRTQIKLYVRKFYYVGVIVRLYMQAQIKIVLIQDNAVS